MAVSLTSGLSDLSKELGETNTNTGTRRIQHYNDAVVDFANDRKWAFLVKENTELSTVSGDQSYAIPAAVLADWRSPGAIKEITLGDGETPIKPIDWDQRGDARFDGKNYFYINPEETTIYFKVAIDAVYTVHIHYYYIPARTTDTTSGTFPIPDRYRKAVALLAAAYVQWSRYLDQQGNRLFNLYAKMVGGIAQQQSERHNYKPRSLPHYLHYRGFRRTYP